MIRRISPALLVIFLAALLAWFVFSTNAPKTRFAVKTGLDLAGGTELIYKADTSSIASADKPGALNSLQSVIDRRVNLFGVAEPLVQLEHSSAVAGKQEDRLLVDLPGVTNIKAAEDAIGRTPVLTFAVVATSSAPQSIKIGGVTIGSTTASTTAASPDVQLIPTPLTGAYLKSAQLQFSNGGGNAVAGSPVILLNFNSQGGQLFQQITSQNIGKQLAIVLDGKVISAPVVQETIPAGTPAEITGNFTPAAARDLVQNLNFGALPVPITLESSDTVGPTLGATAFHAGLIASLVGFALVALFMILWYRLPGVVATAALIIYILITIAVIKFVPITLTASGIAGFILSIGMAVDANVLIFERFKEEIKSGKGAHEAVQIGFGRAWPAIRDGHLTMLISAIILFWVGTSLIQGFALVFGFGVIASLISAVFISRVFLLALLPEKVTGAWRFLLGSGVMKPSAIPAATAEMNKETK